MKPNITTLEKKIADMQRLCERAHLILSENWDCYTDNKGNGPINLLRDLEKVMNGKEYKDLRVLNDQLVRICNKQADRIRELEQQIDKGRKLKVGTKERYDAGPAEIPCGKCVSEMEVNPKCSKCGGAGYIKKWTPI